MEIRVLLLANLLVLACSLVSLITVALANPQIRETRWFALAYACGTAGTALLLLRDRLPATVSQVVANVLVMFCYCFCHRAITEFLGKGNWSIPLQAVLIACGATGMYIYSAIIPDTAMRIIIVSVMVAIQAGITGVMLLRYREPALTSACRLLGTQLFVVSMLMVLRGVLTLHFGADHNYLATQSFIQIAGILVFLVSAAIIPLGFFWMTTARERMRLEESARTDALTGLLNRRALQAELEREFARHRREKMSLSAVMFDLDYFKVLNDTYGHDAGDAALQKVSSILVRDCRTFDLIARFGGEEFLLVLPSTPVHGALELAERLRAEIAATPVEIDGRSISFTASFGVASCNPAADSSELLLKRCDRVMYEAKARGRNCVCVDGVPAPSPSVH